jgi:hypothetical protein
VSPLQACANDELTAEQQEALLAAAEAHNLPLMLDESTGKLVWPGTAEYEEWAAEEPEEEQMDLQVRWCRLCVCVELILSMWWQTCTSIAVVFAA